MPLAAEFAPLMLRKTPVGSRSCINMSSAGEIRPFSAVMDVVPIKVEYIAIVCGRQVTQPLDVSLDVVKIIKTFFFKETVVDLVAVFVTLSQN